MIDGAAKLSLKSGALTFSAYEMGEGPLALCIHGFPDTPHTFRDMLPALASAGYRAVAVTSRGYEESSQPSDHDYSIAALAGDLRGWLDALGAEKAHLIGHDWGANLAYAATALCPQRVEKLVTLAVPHPAAFAMALAGNFDQMRRSWYIYLFQMRGMAEPILNADHFAFLKRLWIEWSPGWTPDASALKAMEDVFSKEGVLEAALGYYRTAFDVTHPRLAESQGLLGVPLTAPTLGICGAEDHCISADVFQSAMPAMLFPAGVGVRRVDGAGHFVHLEKPALVHDAILAHLRG